MCDKINDPFSLRELEMCFAALATIEDRLRFVAAAQSRIERERRINESVSR
jgi:hypothetical protein